jgi:hypothetical protein
VAAERAVADAHCQEALACAQVHHLRRTPPQTLSPEARIHRVDPKFAS